MDQIIHWNKQRIAGVVNLPASKSISNRVLVLSALAGDLTGVGNLSDSDDTKALSAALRGGREKVDVGHAGTAMRFLTAYFALRGGVRELTGSERMKQRPIGVLVDALRGLGAEIEYTGVEGYPPLLIKGRLSGNPERELTLDASVSSQYISALMMIAPALNGGLTIHFDGKVVSGDYIRMTAAMMRLFGVDVQLGAVQIVIPEKAYTPVAFRVEPDWSAASYFYELLAIAGEGELFLPGLSKNSVQGDARQFELWEELGVRTFEEKEGVRLSAFTKPCGYFEADFTEMPDLAPSFVVACCVKDVPFRVSGLDTLYIKECDRVEALCQELAKLGYRARIPVHGELSWNRERNTLISLEIDPRGDHRMAMAFAPAGWFFPGLVIRDAQVVSKSFPGFWETIHSRFPDV